MIKERLKKNLEVISGEHSVDSLHKTAVLGTSHIVREVVHSETWSLSGEDKVEFQNENPSDKRYDKYIDDNDDDDDDDSDKYNKIPSR